MWLFYWELHNNATGESWTEVNRMERVRSSTSLLSDNHNNNHNNNTSTRTKYIIFFRLPFLFFVKVTLLPLDMYIHTKEGCSLAPH